MAERARPMLQEVDQYDGEPVIAIAATQLDGVSRSRAARIVQEWCGFFNCGPSPITDLQFVTRTPKRLFASLQQQTQLQRLIVKWGDYDDLGPLTGMQQLADLQLGSATGVTDLRPLSALQGLRRLHIDGARRVHDYSPIAALTRLEYLGVSGSSNGPHVHADSIAWLESLTSLRKLVFVAVVDDLDYSPILKLGHVERIVLHPQKGMQPSYADLEWASPGVRLHEREDSERVIGYLDEDGSTIGEYRRDIDGQFRLYASPD